MCFRSLSDRRKLFKRKYKMTYIEFFDKDAIENICSCFIKPPERVVLVGDNEKLMNRHAKHYREVLLSRGKNVVFDCYTANRSKIQEVVATLSMIVEKYTDCVFDLTGGDDVFLVATGIILEKYKERNVQMHRVNIRNNTIVDCDLDGETIFAEEEPKITIEESIKVYGGDIVCDDGQEDATCNWNMDADFIKDINAMWNICRANTRLWNTQIFVFNTADEMRKQSDALSVKVPLDRLIEAVERDGGNYVMINGIIQRLKKASLISAVSTENNTFSIKFKNEQVKRCLTVSGRILELKMFLAALEAKEKNGTQTYHDVRTGVNIDWDGEIHVGQDAFDTTNEIDVMMMHGMVPVFVSCKNGSFDNNELYKLNTVATRFGGKYAKKVLIATSLDSSDFSKYIRQRAKDMEIRLIEGYSINGGWKAITEMSDSELKKMMRTLWSS